MRSRLIKQKGETIVEVLLAIAVLGSALGGAFAIVNKSKLTIDANKERYQAQLIANGQADNLKLYTSNSGGVTDLNDPAKTDNDFCLVEGVIKKFSAGPDCKFTVAGYSVAFNVHIYTNVAVPNKFDIQIQWDSLAGNGQDKVELGYGI